MNKLSSKIGFTKFNYLVLFLCLFLIILSIVWGSISADAPYYLGISRDIAEGKVVFKDVNTIYAPLMSYVNAPIYAIFGNINYFWFLGFHFFILAFSAYLLYRIAVFEKSERSFAIFLALFYFLSVLLAESVYINLEVYVALFVLWGYLSLRKQNYLLAGILISMSVLSKQYGVLNFIPFGLYIIFDNKKLFTRQFGAFILGALVPFLCFIIYFVYLEGVAVFKILEDLSGKVYQGQSFDKQYSLYRILSDAKYFIALTVPFIFIIQKFKFKNHVNLVLLVGVLVNLAPLIVQTFPHYFILAYPYIFLLIIQNKALINKRYVLSSVFFAVVGFGVVSYRLYQYREDYQLQVENAKKYEKVYPKGATVFLYGGIRYLYLMNNYKNPVLNTHGYSFQFEPDSIFRAKYPIVEGQ